MTISTDTAPQAVPDFLDNDPAVPNGAAALVELAELLRREQRAWGRWIVAAGRLRAMPTDSPDWDDEARYVQVRYLLWADAWETYSGARRQLTKEA